MEGELLGGSQTFIGVLATIVVLCVVAESGNFIYKIFGEIIAGTKKEIENLKTHLSEVTFNLKLSEDYINFSKAVEQLEKNDSGNSSSFLSKLLNHKMMIDIKIDNYTNAYSQSYFIPIFNKIKEIQLSREQTFSPLYILAFCVLLFICDEICRWIPKCTDLFVGMLTFFIVISCIFFFYVWMKFMRECGTIENVMTEFDSLSKLQSFGKRVKECTELFMFCLDVFAILSLCCFLLALFCPNIPQWLFWSLMVLMSLSLFVWIGHHHHYKTPHHGKYSHSLLFQHFIVLVVLSFIFSCLFLTPILCDFRLPYTNLYAFRMVCVVFIILNGLIFPFLFPYIANRNVLDFAKKWGGKGEDDAQAEGNHIKSQINEMLHTINDELERQVEWESLGTDCDIKFMKEMKIEQP